MTKTLVISVCLIAAMGHPAYTQELPLFNGPEYTSFYRGVTGHPLFGSDSLATGTVFYDGIRYNDVHIAFNIADNQVFIKEPAQGHYIRLLNEKIGYFMIGSSRFEGGNDGRFYEIVYRDGVKIWVYRYKLLRPAFRPEDSRRFIASQEYFVASRGNLISIKNPRAVNASMISDSLLTVATLQVDMPDTAAGRKKMLEQDRVYQLGDTYNGVQKNKVSLAGYIRDAKTGESVIGATIEADSAGSSVLTDQYGYYSINLSRGKHTILVSGAGIQKAKRQVLLINDAKLDIEVAAEVGSLKTVMVIAEKNSRVRSPQMSVEKLNIRSIKQVPVVFGEADVLRVVTTMPGVTTTGEASTGFNVRGGSPDQNLILFNDATIYNPSHLFGFFSAFNPDVVKSVELYKSSIPEKFGGRLSSVLDIASREGNSKKIAGSGGIGPLTSKLTVEGPLSFRTFRDSGNAKTTFIASARTTYSDWLLRNISEKRYDNSTASFQDFSLNITQKLDSRNSIYLAGYYSSDKFRLQGDTSYMYGNANFNAKWKHVFNNKLYSLLTMGYDHYRYQVKSEANEVNAFRLRFDIEQYHFRTAFNYSPSNAHTIEMGLQSIYYSLHPGSFLPASTASEVDPNTLQPEQALESALYVGDRYTISPRLSLSAGIRYAVFNYLGPYNADVYAPNVPRDSNTITGTISAGRNKVIKTWSAPEYRAAFRYALNDVASLKVGFNTMRQYIHMLSNTTIISPTDTWKLSDANIRPQRSYQVSAGYYRNFRANTIEASLELYYRGIKNALDYKSGAQLLMNKHIAADVINAKGKSYGAELMVKKTTGRINGWLSYTYSRTFLQQDDALAGELINLGKDYPANFDKPHVMNIIGNYRFTQRFSLSVNTVYSTGRPITLPVALFDLGGSQRVFYLQRNQQRIPDYFRADLSFMIEGNHKVKQLTHNSWSFGVYNLTARKNPYSVFFRGENGVIKGYQLSIFGTIIPFVTYNFRF